MVSGLEAQALSLMAERRQELHELLASLVEVDTSNWGHEGQEANIVPLLRDLYANLGMAVDHYMPDDVPGVLGHEDYNPGRNTDRRPNIDGLLPGRLHGTDRQRTLVLAAHTDIMPAGDPARWAYPPFAGTIADGKMYGRGTNDCKFGLASSIFALRILRDLGVTLDADVLVAGYADEERGGGNGALAECLRHPIDSVVNLDGGRLELWAASAGGGVGRCRITANDPQDSAELVLLGLDVVRTHLRKFGERRHAELLADPLFAGSGMAAGSYRVTRCSAGDGGVDLEKAVYEFAFYTTASRGQIEREFDEIWQVTQEPLAALGLTMVELGMMTRFFHCLRADLAAPGARALASAIRTVTGKDPVVAGATLSDLSIFLKYGSADSFNFGVLRDFALPGGAHQNDEFVELDALLRVAQALALYLLQAGRSSDAPAKLTNR